MPLYLNASKYNQNRIRHTVLSPSQFQISSFHLSATGGSLSRESQRMKTHTASNASGGLTSRGLGDYTFQTRRKTSLGISSNRLSFPSGEIL